MDSIVTYSVFAATGALCSVVSFRLYEWYTQTGKEHELDKSDGNANDKATEIAMMARASRDQRKPPEIWNTVLFFPDPFYPTREENVNPDITNTDSPTYKFLEYFKAAKISIYMCIFLASSPPLEKILIEKCRAGLIVLLISDWDTTQTHNNFLITNIKRRVHDQVQIRLRNNGRSMHNKFAIIDEEAVLTGSMNWTQAAFRGNYEDVLITTHEKIVGDYKKEFLKIWHESEDYTGDRNRN